MKKLLQMMLSIGMVVALTLSMSSTVEAKSDASKIGKVTDIVWQYDEYGSVNYGFKVGNKDKKKALSDVKVKVTIRGADNQILGTDTQYISYIAPKDEIYCGWVNSTDEVPEKIEVKIKGGELVNASKSKKWDDVFEISNVSEFVDEYSYRVTGEIVNKSKKDYMPIISAVLKQEGKIVAIYSTYADEIEGEDDSTFELYGPLAPSAIPVHNSIECHAYNAY